MSRNVLKQLLVNFDRTPYVRLLIFIGKWLPHFDLEREQKETLH